MVTKSTSYLGNPNLKRSGVPHEWTADMVIEYQKCAEDPIYFIEKYMKIIHVDHGLMNFKLYDYQKKMILSMKNNRNTIINTARQIGKSTCTIGYILWFSLFTPDKDIAILANKGDTAREILGKYHLAYQYLPKFLQQGTIESNKGTIELENNSRIIATSSSSDAIRGYAFSFIMIDECAFLENWEQFSASTLPTITSGKTTKMVFVSTPNGLNHFYKYWTDAIKKKNNFNPIKVVWSDVPGRDLEWKKATLSLLNNDLQKFSQENEAEFLGSSGTLISGAKLKALVYQDSIAGQDNIFLKMYQKPIKSTKDNPKHYMLIADTSEGKGLDYSAFSVIDISSTPFNQVCTYRNNSIAPGDFAQIIYNIARQYNDAYILAENNNIGYEVARCLKDDLEYDNMMYSGNNGRSGKTLTNGFGGHQNTELGIKTSKSVKQTGCSMLKLLVEGDQLIINDFETIAELNTFSKKGNSYEAESGAHDDLTMTLVLFAWASKEKYFQELTDINTIQKVRDEINEQIDTQLIPFFSTNMYATLDDDVQIAVNNDKWLSFDDDSEFDRINDSRRNPRYIQRHW